MKTITLSAKDYDDSTQNYGDCTIIDNGRELLIYDCGCQEHAERVKHYMKDHDYRQAIFVLSHNDSDHFDGLPYLLHWELISKIYTTLLLKYVDELYDRIGDKRKTRESIKAQILKLYNNIAQLSGEPIYDIYENSLDEFIAGVSFVGPSLDDMLDAVAKRLDTREGDTIDGETIQNATSIQLTVSSLANGKLLLTGDSSYEAISDNLPGHAYIQLPHHGKNKTAQKIFERSDINATKTTFIVSDNTGLTNGGSDDLDSTGFHVLNTQDGDIKLSSTSGCYPLYGAGLTGCWGE